MAWQSAVEILAPRCLSLLEEVAGSNRLLDAFLGYDSWSKDRKIALWELSVDEFPAGDGGQARDSGGSATPRKTVSPFPPLVSETSPMVRVRVRVGPCVGRG